MSDSEPAMRCALEKVAAIAQLAASGRRVMEGDTIVFTGAWAHLGMVSVKAALDEADAALSTTKSGNE